MISYIWYMIALGCVLAAAVIGMDFSPSFTAMFLVAFLVLTVLGELCSHFRDKQHERIFVLLGQIVSIVGAILVIASVLIYAAGDDWLWNDIPISLLMSLIVHFVIYLLLYRKQGRKLGVAAGIENWILLEAGIFTLFCAASSAALWPYGFGILLILAARRLGEVKTDFWLSRGATVLGTILCAVFLVAPMVF